MDILFSCFEGLRRVIRSEYFNENREEILKGLEDATSFGQLESKKWLLKILKDTEIRIFKQEVLANEIQIKPDRLKNSFDLRLI